jgi:hypothetical protein
MSNTWRDFEKQNEKFLRAFPEFRNNKKVKSTLGMTSLWFYATSLRNAKRYHELVWIQPNLIEITVNALLSTYFAGKGGLSNIPYHAAFKRANKFVSSLNLYEKANLLFFLGLISNDLFGKLESFRTQRNDLMHKLMPKVSSGASLDALCRNLCENGFDLETELHEILMNLARELVNDK